MNYIDKAKQELAELAGKVVDAGSSSSSSQTVTISRPRTQVEQFWRDPEQLSEVLGDIAEVRSADSTSYQWVLRRGDEDVITWNSTLTTLDDGLRFVHAPGADAPGDGAEIRLTFRDAPRDLGTEVTLYVKSPVPDVLTGAATFKALYRARALLQTGELPTLRPNPSTRAAAR